MINFQYGCTSSDLTSCEVKREFLEPRRVKVEKNLKYKKAHVYKISGNSSGTLLCCCHEAGCHDYYHNIGNVKHGEGRSHHISCLHYQIGTGQCCKSEIMMLLLIENFSRR